MLIRSIAPRNYTGWHKSRLSVRVDSGSDNDSFQESCPKSESRDWFPMNHPGRSVTARREGNSFPSRHSTKKGYENKECELTLTSMANPERSVTHSRVWTNYNLATEIFSESGDGSLLHLLRYKDLKARTMEQSVGGGFSFKPEVPSLSSSCAAFSEPVTHFQSRKERQLHETIMTDRLSETQITKPVKNSTSIAKAVPGHRGFDCDSLDNLLAIPRGDFRERTSDGISYLANDNFIGWPDNLTGARASHLQIPSRQNESAKCSSLEFSSNSVASSLKSLLMSPTQLYSGEFAHGSRIQQQPRRFKHKIREIPRTGSSGPTLV